MLRRTCRLKLMFCVLLGSLLAGSPLLQQLRLPSRNLVPGGRLL